MKYLEIIAVIFGILSVWYARKERILVFPFGIVSVAIFVYIFFVGKLYANAGINIIYLLTNIYGWYNWLRPQKENKQLQITKTSLKENVWLLIGIAIVYVGILFLLKWSNKSDYEYINSLTPWIDTANSTVFFFATILMTVKKVENWLFWIVGNIISIPFFLAQGLYFTSFQYGVFFVLSILGYLEWKKKAEKSNG